MAIGTTLRENTKTGRTAPTNQESTFRYDEVFFSVTDLKSRITSANETFIRISKFPENEIIGALHNLIRHPHMPRAVFKIFWDHLKQGTPVAAYVKNMAKDGSYYWVMALAFPCKDGYLSIRIKPGSKLFNTVKKIYADTLKYEKKQEQHYDQRNAMLRSEEYLLARLREAGYLSYDHFMRNALQDEMLFRQLYLKDEGFERRYTLTELDELKELNTILEELVYSSETLRDIHTALQGYSDYLLKLARSILLLSMNAQVGAARLQTDDYSLQVVAEHMGEQTIEGEKKLNEIKERLLDFSSMIGTFSFDMISTKLQVEMTLEFLQDLADCDLCDEDHSTELALLQDAFMPGLAKLSGQLEELPLYMKKLSGWIKDIEKFLMVLRFIHISGEIEIARMDQEQGSFQTTFHELLSEISNADVQVKGLSEVITSNSLALKRYRALQKEFGMAVTQVQPF